MEAFNVEMQMSKLVWRLRPAFGCDRCLPTPILQTFLALAFVYRVFWMSSVSALAADVPAIDMSDHRSELKGFEHSMDIERSRSFGPPELDLSRKIRQQWRVAFLFQECDA